MKPILLAGIAAGAMGTASRLSANAATLSFYMFFVCAGLLFLNWVWRWEP
jgi:hypothetical protein